MIRNARLLRVIDQDMLRRIPTTKTEIHATHERDRLVNHAELLVLQKRTTKTRPNQLLAPRSEAEEGKKKYTHAPNKTSLSGNATASAGP